MSTAILKNRHRRDELLARADLDFLCILAAHRTAVLALAHARSGFCGHALADPDIEAAVVVEDQVDGRSAVGEVGDDGRVGDGEDRVDSQEEEGEDVHDGELLGVDEKLYEFVLLDAGWGWRRKDCVEWRVAVA